MWKRITTVPGPNTRENNGEIIKKKVPGAYFSGGGLKKGSTKTSFKPGRGPELPKRAEVTKLKCVKQDPKEPIERSWILTEG